MLDLAWAPLTLSLQKVMKNRHLKPSQLTITGLKVYHNEDSESITIKARRALTNLNIESSKDYTTNEKRKWMTSCKSGESFIYSS